MYIIIHCNFDLSDELSKLNLVLKLEMGTKSNIRGTWVLVFVFSFCQPAQIPPSRFNPFNGNSAIWRSGTSKII